MQMSEPSAPRRQAWGCWPCVAASLAIHALLLGLGNLYFWKDSEVRFSWAEHSVAVCLVSPGVPQKGEAQEPVSDVKPEPFSENAMEPARPVPTQPRKVAQKKKSAVEKRKPAPPSEAPGSESPSPERKGEAEGNGLVPHQGVAGGPSKGDASAPTYARFVPPEYPPQARRRNLGGRVLLRVLVDTEGRAKEMEVVESSHPMFTEAARKSARRSRYVPLMRQGRSLESWVLIPFQFTLK